VRGRFARWDGPPVESGEDGAFTIALPWGGLHALELKALHVEPIGWVELRQNAEDRRGFFLDADRPGAPGILDLDRRVLYVAEGVGRVYAEGLRAFLVVGEGVCGALSRPIDPGPQRYWKQRAEGWTKVIWLTPKEGIPFDVAPRGLTVVDTR
jgi:hypothetical protein